MNSLPSLGISALEPGEPCLYLQDPEGSTLNEYKSRCPLPRPRHSVFQDLEPGLFLGWVSGSKARGADCVSSPCRKHGKPLSEPSPPDPRRGPPAPGKPGPT